MASQQKSSRLFSFPNNLLSGIACSNPTFSSFSEMVFIWVKSHLCILESWNNLQKGTFYNKSHKDFLFSKQLIIRYSLFKSCLFQFFIGGFHMIWKWLLHSMQLKQPVARYISQWKSWNLFSLLNNLSLGLTCLKSAFYSFSKVVCICVKNDYAQNVITTGAHRKHVSIIQNVREVVN